VAEQKSWWKKVVSKLGFGGKDYAQAGSKAGTKGTVGTGMADHTIRAIRARNANIAQQSK
jgi:hypothetical protein